MLFADEAPQSVGGEHQEPVLSIALKTILRHEGKFQGAHRSQLSNGVDVHGILAATTINAPSPYHLQEQIGRTDEPQDFSEGFIDTERSVFSLISQSKWL